MFVNQLMIGCGCLKGIDWTSRQEHFAMAKLHYYQLEHVDFCANHFAPQSMKNSTGTYTFD